MRLAVLGAGPVGLEAAAAAGRAGIEVIVLEASGRAGGSPAAWPHVRWYTPWSMNTSALGREIVGADLPMEQCPTGGELFRLYLQPLARWLDVRLHHRVLGVAHWESANPTAGFRLLVATPSGETWMAADAILDCTGCPSPLPTGPSGLPAPGEAALAARGLIQFGPVPVTGLEGRRVLLIGDGLDAARVVRELDALTPRPLISWIGPSTPGAFSSENDPLGERVALAAVSLEVSRRSDRWSNAWVDRYRIADDGRVEVRVSTGDTLFVDSVLACTGFHGDRSLTLPPDDPRSRALGSRAQAGHSDFLLHTGINAIDETIASLLGAQPR